MDYFSIVELVNKGNNICNIPLRACYYARVSTDSNEQLNSLENQSFYYKNYILNNTNWEYIDGYIDAGKSGVSVKNRDAFMRMIDDACQKKFDLIITKEVSRFARDLEDSIHYIRKLKQAGVGVFFENQNLNTFDYNSELILNIMFNLAQEESRKLSKRVKFGHMQAINNGHVLGSSNITGYKKDNCKLVIDEVEAVFIRKMFELYSTGKYGLNRLSKELGNLGFYNKNGNLYDKDSLKRMLQNPKYMGYYRGKTTEVLDYRTKKRKIISKDKQIIYRSNEVIPPIISENIWFKVNDILNDRSSKYSSNNRYSGSLKYPFSSKIICCNDKAIYYRKKSRGKYYWSCCNKLKYGNKTCCSLSILEDDLYNIFKYIFNEIIIDRNFVFENLFKIYNDFNKKCCENNNNKMKMINNKMQVLFNLSINSKVDEIYLKKEYELLKNEYNNLMKCKDFNLNKKRILNFIDKFYYDDIDNLIRNFLDRILIDSRVGKISIYFKELELDDILNKVYFCFDGININYNVFFN